MKTKRKTWYLQKKDILYVEENHDGKYGAKGKERLPQRKLTPEDVQRVNAWNKSKRAQKINSSYFIFCAVFSIIKRTHSFNPKRLSL